MRLRSPPVALSRAMQLSRQDRAFVDYLYQTVELWHTATTASTVTPTTEGTGENLPAKTPPEETPVDPLVLSYERVKACFSGKFSVT